MGNTRPGHTAVEVTLPDEQLDAIEEAAEEHDIPMDLVATALIKRSLTGVAEQVEASDQTFVEVLADDLGYLSG